MLNPLFSNDDHDKKEEEQHFLLSKRHSGRIEPIHGNLHRERAEKPVAKPLSTAENIKAAAERFANPAVEMIRGKLNTLYASEPNAKEEIKEVKPLEQRSKHQQFMYDLSTSGKSLADIQTAWHNYYVGLPDTEKHEVWQEFYTTNDQRKTAYSALVEKQQAQPKTEEEQAEKGTQKAHVGVMEATPPVLPHRERRTRQIIKKQILDRVSLETQEKARRHFKSLLFGLGTGFIVLAIFLFGFFNEVIIAPFIQPSRTANATPIILNANGVTPSDKDEIIIPKINLQIPLDFSVTTTAPGAIENSLDNGIVHYPTTVKPGEQGNTSFFGHSSNNIFNKGKYKFAFVLLRTLEAGDIFYLTHGGKVYSYRVFDKRVVEPTEVSVLNNIPGRVATATLITCDPPGTSLKRMVVWGEQVSPDPNGNPAVAAPTTSNQPQALPSDGPTLWGRFMKWLRE